MPKIKTFVRRAHALMWAIFLATGIAFTGVVPYASADSLVTVSGVVYAQNGYDIKDVSVTAVATSNPSITFGPVLTDAFGDYHLQVQPGVYDIHFDAPSGTSLQSAVVGGVTVLGNQAVNEQMSYTSQTFSGRLVDQNGVGFPNFDITIGGAQQYLYSHFATDSNGNFNVSVPGGAYTSMDIWTYSNSTVMDGYPLSRFEIEGGAAAHPISLDLRSSDVNQVLTINLVKMTVVPEDASGNPIPGHSVSYGAGGGMNYGTNAGGVTVSTSDNSTYVLSYNGGVNLNGTTGADGTFTSWVPSGPGIVFYPTRIAAYTPGGSDYAFNDSTVTTTADQTVVIHPTQPVPPAPTNLSIPSPTSAPVLTWTGVPGAVTYGIWRDTSIGSAVIGTTTGTSFTDTSALPGNHTYWVVAYNSGGQSGPSNQVSVQVTAAVAAPTNLTAPSPASSAQLSWNGSTGATSYNIYRNGTKIGSSNVPSYADASAAEGTSAYYVTAVNSSSESGPSNSINVVIDRTAPAVSMPTWSANPLLQGQNTTLSTTVSDSLSGVAGVQYAVDGGTPQPMTFDTASGTWQATFGSTLTANTYNVTITATDNAGNTSAGVTDILAVYTTSNGYVTGHARVQPSASDTMPIALDTSSKPADLVLGFTNVTAPTTGSFDVDYSIKNKQNEFSLSSTGINWVIVQDSTHASILGRADLTAYVNGVKTVTQNVSVRFDIVLGTNGAPDQIAIKIFNPNLNPNTDAPTYTISDTDTPTGANLMIHP